MSIIHTILPKNNLEINQLYDCLENEFDNFEMQQRGENNFYMWLGDKSTRGVDLSLEKNKTLEIRNTILSNNHDYHLTNKIIEFVAKNTDGFIFNEEDERICNFPVFNEKRIEELQINDCNTILILSKAKEEITIFGPKRKIYFGPNIHKTFEHTLNDPNKMVSSVFDLILNVQYHIPDYEYGDVLETDSRNKNEPTILKLLTNNANCLIGKYDYILFNRPNEESLIMISNLELNSILPSQWTLVDEYTVVAPKIPEIDWGKLIEKAEKYDVFETFMSQSK